jgi:hypothetical protein
MIAMGGGSVGAQRRKIIMEIIERCGGLFPGEKELWYPFASADEGSMLVNLTSVQSRWQRKHLLTVVRLRQLKFSFRDKKGSHVDQDDSYYATHLSNFACNQELERKIIEDPTRTYLRKQMLRRRFEKPVNFL